MLQRAPRSEAKDDRRALKLVLHWSRARHAYFATTWTDAMTYYRKAAKVNAAFSPWLHRHTIKGKLAACRILLMRAVRTASKPLMPGTPTPSGPMRRSSLNYIRISASKRPGMRIPPGRDRAVPRLLTATGDPSTSPSTTWSPGCNSIIPRFKSTLKNRPSTATASPPATTAAARSSASSNSKPVAAAGMPTTATPHANGRHGRHINPTAIRRRLQLVSYSSRPTTKAKIPATWELSIGGH